MSLGFSKRCLDNACAALMKLTSEKGVRFNGDCSDFTDPQIVSQYLIDITIKEYKTNYPVESGKIYRCVYRNLFISFENIIIQPNIENDVFTQDGAPPTCAVVYWQSLGY